MKFKPSLFFSLLALILSSCQTKTEKANSQQMGPFSKEEESFIRDTFRIDANLKEQADLIMEGQPEVWTFDDATNKDSTSKRKKSSIVKIIVLHDDINEIEMVNELRCVANFKADALDIDISINSGFSGKGVSISYAGEKFTTHIYEFTDIDDPYEEKREFKIEKQKLVLDKPKYNVGDSLYGYIYIRMVDNMNTKYYADGLFRAKVTN